MDFVKLEYVGPIRKEFKSSDSVYDEAIGRTKMVEFHFLKEKDDRLIADHVPKITAHKMVKSSKFYKFVEEGKKNKLVKINMETTDPSAILKEQLAQEKQKRKKLEGKLMRQKQAKGKVVEETPPKKQEAVRYTPVK